MQNTPLVHKIPNKLGSEDVEVSVESAVNLADDAVTNGYKNVPELRIV